MSLFAIPDSQLEQLVYPNGRGSFYYGNQPIQVNRNAGWVNGVQPGGVSDIGGVPVKTGIAQSGSVPLPTTGMPSGAAATAGGMGGYGSIASGAISQIAQVASDWTAAKAKAEALKNQSAIPNIPESGGALAGFQAPSIRIG